MRNFNAHLLPLPRHFPQELQISSIGYIAQKRDWIRHTFDTFNYSFILRGRGRYRTEQREYEVRAPCVITQWPSVYVEYGPDRDWEEIYLVYQPALLDALIRRRLVAPAKPVWYLKDPSHTRAKLAELREHLDDLNRFGRADEVDRICEAAILESLISETQHAVGKNEHVIRAIRAHVDEHFHSSIDFDELALDHSLSPASFRRYWSRYIHASPARYVMELRIRKACRLLAETDMPVGDIAGALGFQDPLYFSRRFREVVGETATAYRQHNHLSISFGEAQETGLPAGQGRIRL